MSLAEALKKKGVKVQGVQKPAPLWKGPEEEGVTQSLLSRFLTDRERFRLLVVEGLQGRDRWNHKIGYGDMWHLCEEVLAAKPTLINGWCGAMEKVLQDYVKENNRTYFNQQEEIVKWYDVCRVQFPEYVRHWAKHQDSKKRIPLLQEQPFCVSYGLPSGRIVKLLGVWDAVDLIDDYIWVRENKSKGNPDKQQIERQVTFDLQTMFYIVALKHWIDDWEIAAKLLAKWARRLKGKGLAGVSYNVVRRPLSGGRGTIKPHEGTTKKLAETREHFFARLRDDYIRAEPDYFFMRWEIRVHDQDVYNFCKQSLDPILEQLCSWWQWVRGTHDPYNVNKIGNPEGIHYRMPYGVYSPLLDIRTGSTEYDTYLETGSEVGLVRITNLFPELTDHA
jgi:hypothetical protein